MASKKKDKEKGEGSKIKQRKGATSGRLKKNRENEESLGGQRDGLIHE